MPDLIIDVDKRDMERQFDEFARQTTKAMTIAMMSAFRIVGLRSTQNYMTRSHVTDSSSGYNIGTAGGSKLNIRSGRLARSLVDAFDFSGGGGGTNESIRKINVSGNKVSGIYGSEVPYANIHEKGGTISASSSPFLVFKIGPFWYQKKSVNIDARPYLEPALEDSRDDIDAAFKSALEAVAIKVSDK